MRFINPKLLRKAYDNAVNRKLESFEFQGACFLTRYAAYLLEFLEGPAKV